MGVKGLWRLLLPVGRRISIETLEGRVLAIDASIWLTQFLKANRDPDTGTVRPGAHLVGFLRRICKLLYHGIRPVFVFDGATPEIKLREIRARRERREKMTIGIGGPAGSGGGGGDGDGDGDGDDAAIKRMARKLLVAELKRQKERKLAAAKSAKGGSASASGATGGGGGGGAFSSNFNLDGDDDDEVKVEHENNKVKDENKVQGRSPSRGDEKEKQQMAENNGDAEDDGIIDLSELDDGAEYLRRGQDTEDHDRNDWDNAKPALFGSDDDSTSASSDASKGEVQIPEDEGQLDIDAVLSLPASQRKDIVEKAKRQQRMRSRKEFMPAAANPEAYSQVQLRNFLRSSNLNKKITEMGVKASRGEGVDGLEGEAIASDATRRFIFTKDTDREKDNAAAVGSDGRGSTTADTSYSGAAESQLDESPSRYHRLRRLGKQASTTDSDDGDDGDIFGGELNAKGTNGAAAASGKARPFYSSSEDDDDETGGGGFLVDGHKNTKNSGSPDPKRSNYKSHTHHDASGWTLDEANVFGPTAGDRNLESSDADSGAEGFLPENMPNSSSSRHIGGTMRGSSSQVVEDEMLACALQQAEDEVVAESVGGGDFLVRTTFHAKKRTQKHGEVSFLRSQEESDALLAAQLEAEERNQGGDIGRRSELIDLSGSSDKRSSSKDRSPKGPVVLLNSDSDNDDAKDDDEADVEVLPPPGKRTRGGVRHKKCPVTFEVSPKDGIDNTSEEEDDEGIDWEDGNADDEVLAEDLLTRVQPQHANSDQADLNSPEGLAKESDDDANGDGEFVWEDGDDKETEFQVKKKAKPVANDSPKNPAEDESASEEGDYISWEDGEGRANNKAGSEDEEKPMVVDNTDVDDAEDREDTGGMIDISQRRNHSRRSSQSETDGEYGDEALNDFTTSSPSNANMAALKHAEATAANLTDWAGRAVRRAIAAHMEESGTHGSPEATGTVTSAKTPGFSPISEEVFLDDSSNASSDEELDDAINEAVTREAALKTKETLGPTAPPVASKEIQPRARNMAAAVASTSIAKATMATAATPAIDTSLDALRIEHQQMRDELNRQQRDMDTMTDEMKEEIVQLLQLFGIPYVNAPAEAEAQACALEKLGLVDGVVTEDSDAFVFGGKKVYKNIFDDQKYVECYAASDAQRDLGLGHNHMIALAMLLGGDYTEGVRGVGIVNGMEVLQAFDVSSDIKSGLTKFRQWLDGFEPTDNVTTRTPAETEFHNKHRSARNRWVAPKDFPSASVLTAYQKPVVDKSDARFSWGLPDIEALRVFCAQKIGWPAEETDRAIVPVIKALESAAGTRQTQLESYFMRYEDNIKFANVKSKRLQSVLRKVNGTSNAEAGAGTINDQGGEPSTSNGITEEAEATRDIELMGINDSKAGGKKRKRKAGGKKNKRKKAAGV